jgi:hypothetical protein
MYTSVINTILYLAITTKQSPFLFLALDLPAAPLYQDELEQNIIPQVPLVTILNKYNGTQAQVNLLLLQHAYEFHPVAD